MGHYTHLSLEDRYELFKGLKEGRSIREIASSIGRHFSTLYRELKHFTDQDYHPFKAEERALRIRQQARKNKIQRNPTLHAYITDHLKIGWSPEQIVGRLRRKKSKYHLCHETIYQHIYRKRQKLHQFLPYKRKNRKKRHLKKLNVCRFGNKRIITNRPAIIAQRTHIGHWEGDRIEFERFKGPAVTTLLERKSRLLLLIKNTNRSSDHVMQAIINKFKEGPHKACRSITFDQGVEFARPEHLERAVKCKVYYCHTHSPWEKGSNENMNGRIRWRLPRKRNVLKITQEELDLIAWQINNTPRKCLDFKTPKEVFLKHYQFDCRTWF